MILKDFFPLMDEKISGMIRGDVEGDVFLVTGNEPFSIVQKASHYCDDLWLRSCKIHISRDELVGVTYRKKGG